MRLFGAATDIKPRRRREIYEDVAEQSQPGGAFYVMVALSTVIAAYGLIINSAAVVIGAMLVAPLMGPIFGIALALSSGNRRLLWTAIQSEALGILLAVGVAAVIGLVPLRLPPDTEWLMRTQPTLFDLAIALASGLAGAYALVDERVSPALPGVAVAVALLPPLAACGLSLATMRWEMAAGAMMLFTANFFAIQLASAAVFSLFGMLRVQRRRRRAAQDDGADVGDFLRRFWPSIAALIVVGWFLGRTMLGLIAHERLAGRIEETLAREVETSAGARVSEFDFQRQSGKLRVTATVMTPRAFEPPQVEDAEEALQEALNRDVHLIIRSLISRDVDRSGAVFITDRERELAADERRRRQFLSTVSQVVSQHLQDVPGAELLDVHREQPDGEAVVTAVVRAPSAIGPEEVGRMQDALRREMSTPLRLVVRTVPTRVASSDGFVHTEEDAAGLRRDWLGRQSARIIETWLKTTHPTAELSEVSIQRDDSHERVVADVVTPEALTADDAREAEGRLRVETGSDVELVLRYRIGGQIASPRAGSAQAREEQSGGSN
ncbi:MAG: TIGR00341 family protein [Armatimonadota bacterium]